MDRHEFVELAHAVIKLGTSERTIRRRIEEGELFARKVGKKWYVQIPVELPAQSHSVNQAAPELPALNATHEFVAPAQYKAPAPTAPFVPQNSPIGPETRGITSEHFDVHANSYARPDTSQIQNNSSFRPQGHKRQRDSNRADHEPDPTDNLDKHFSVGRLAAWSKVRLLQSVLTDSLDQADRNEAAAALLEGYLGYGEQKIDSYKLCRSILCRLATRVAARGDNKLLDSVTDALGASHALVITLNRRNERQTGRSSH